ncbi:MAG: succinate--CoA ligase subunit alpha [Candidatus Hecatellales archaeon]|nr:MAG: succinate--CoA ligase subunit alpha [Candidatus Hecatellales archaeon]
MAILIDDKTPCIVQGITGRVGVAVTRVMVKYGTKIVAGVSPGRGGSRVDDIPVYDTVEEAVENHPEIKASAVIVPALFAKEAALEAMDAGVKLIVLNPERVPHQDMLELIEYSKRYGAMIIGPNSPGIVSPHKAMLGIYAAGAGVDWLYETFKPGPVGVISRSGGQSTTVTYLLTSAGIGQTTVIGIGGDPFVGTRFVDLLPLFEKDEETKAVVIFGEIGTTQEEEVAELLKRGGFSKPLIAYVAGRAAKPGMRYGHAGAIIERGVGTAEGKMKVLREAGAFVLDSLSDLPRTVKQALNL